MWNADFFDPAAPLLAVAPWIVVRGNHEDCDRAGEGWIRFLERLPPGASVPRPHRHILGDFGVVVVDGAKADDPKGDTSALAGTLRNQFAEVLAKVPAQAWIASHRPFNSMRSVLGKPQNDVDNHELAFGALRPAGIRMCRRSYPFLSGRRFRRSAAASACGRHRRR